MPTRAVLDATANRFIFIPDEGTWMLRGDAQPDGTIVAERSQPGADKKLYTTRLQATRTPDGIIGTYTTPRCVFTLSLRL